MSTKSHASSPASQAFRLPSYDCRELAESVSIAVYVPGVDASGVEVEMHGPDLLVTARKRRFVRVNWQSLHLEGSQRDYRLRLRLGLGVDYGRLTAEFDDGVLRLSVPKKRLVAAESRRLECVA